MPINHLYVLLQLFPEKPWDWEIISANPGITWEIICARPEESWDWIGISANPNITWEIICTHPEKPWCWYSISSNPGITWEIISAHPDKPWKWHYISRNKFDRYNAAVTIQRWWKRTPFYLTRKKLRWIQRGDK